MLTDANITLSPFGRTFSNITRVVSAFTNPILVEVEERNFNRYNCIIGTFEIPERDWY